jgi:hypothetical protein
LAVPEGCPRAAAIVGRDALTEYPRHSPLEKLFGEATEALAAPTPALHAILALGCLFWLAAALAAALGVICYWRICAKAGYSGAMSLLCLAPGVGAVILMCVLAFGDWSIRSGAMALLCLAPGVGMIIPMCILAFGDWPIHAGRDGADGRGLPPDR